MKLQLTIIIMLNDRCNTLQWIDQWWCGNCSWIFCSICTCSAMALISRVWFLCCISVGVSSTILIRVLLRCSQYEWYCANYNCCNRPHGCWPGSCRTKASNSNSIRGLKNTLRKSTGIGGLLLTRCTDLSQSHLCMFLYSFLLFSLSIPLAIVI